MSQQRYIEVSVGSAEILNHKKSEYKGRVDLICKHLFMMSK